MEEKKIVRVLEELKKQRTVKTELLYRDGIWYLQPTGEEERYGE